MITVRLTLRPIPGSGYDDIRELVERAVKAELTKAGHDTGRTVDPDSVKVRDVRLTGARSGGKRW